MGILKRIKGKGKDHCATACPPPRDVVPRPNTRYCFLCRRSGRVQKISPRTGIRSPDRPARSESLYRLGYPGRYEGNSSQENGEHHARLCSTAKTCVTRSNRGSDVGQACHEETKDRRYSAQITAYLKNMGCRGTNWIYPARVCRQNNISPLRHCRWTTPSVAYSSLPPSNVKRIRKAKRTNVLGQSVFTQDTSNSNLYLDVVPHRGGGGTRWRSWLRHCATSRKVAVSIPDGVTGTFH